MEVFDLYVDYIFQLLDRTCRNTKVGSVKSGINDVLVSEFGKLGSRLRHANHTCLTMHMTRNNAIFYIERLD